MGQGAGDTRFLDETPGEIFVLLLGHPAVGADGFNGHHPADHRVEGLVDHAHRSFAECAGDLVSPDGFRARGRGHLILPSVYNGSI